MTELKAKLAQLKELHELGLLTDTDFVEQKRALVAVAMGTPPAAPASALLAGATRVEAPPASAPVETGRTPVRPAALEGATSVDPLGALPSRLGSYRILGVVGAGGMGTVVRARHEEEGWAAQQGGDVAIKLIHPHIAAQADFRARFFAEAALGRRVQHPGLATVYDVVSEGPWLGTILEYVHGRELSEWLRPGGLPFAKVLELLAPLADALDHLHAQGIVHRDLKPANVKVRPDGRPMLLDLGIAKDLSARSEGHTKTMTTMGTSAWMAPEQADAKAVTPAADVYAFALLVYALRSGQMPWEPTVTEHRILATKLMGRLVPLATRVAGCRQGVSEQVMAALSVAPELRPARCSELLASLRTNRPTGSSPATPEAGASAARLSSEVQALLAHASSLGVKLTPPATVSKRWLEQARARIQEILAARRQAEALALATEAAQLGARLKVPETVSARWLEKAEARIAELRIARLRADAEALAAEAASLGATLTIPDSPTPRWLEKAQAKVAELRQARLRAQAEALGARAVAQRPSRAAAAPPSRRERAKPPIGRRSRGPAAGAVLIWSEGNPDEKVYPFEGDALSIGAGRGNDIQIRTDSKVSRFHCRLFRRNGELYLEDTRSSNGTLVNGALITTRRLFGGEEVIVGETFFRFRIL